MRKIIIVRGPQGTGKSSFIRALGLEGHYLSFDKVREVVSGDTVSTDGEMTVPQQHNQLVRAITFESLHRRMSDGETIAFEATLPTARDVKAVTDIAREYRYKILIIDFFGVEPEEAIIANARRPERVRVPEYAIHRCYEEAETQELPSKLEVIRIDDMYDVSAQLEIAEAFLKKGLEIRDLSPFKSIVHIGDLQGTLHPMLSPESPLADGLKDDTFYIFCGDLLDRGVENGKVARWFLDNAIGRTNVAIIAGNHEDHIEADADGKVPGSREYRDRTKPQLNAEGITSEELAAIATSTVPLCPYKWADQYVLVTHGGLTRWPQNLHLVPETILRRGNGQYGHGIDKMWVDNNAESGFIQIHGHRNAKMLPVLAAENGKTKSFNLEGQVEFGGHMRFAILDANGWSTIKIRSKEYRSMVEEYAIAQEYGRKQFDNSAPMTNWAAAGNVELVPLSDETIAAFDNHKMVVVNQQESMPHVSSVGFTKSAFYSKTWDDYTTVARGLFIDNIDNTIVARSYEKFFNHGERKETSDEGLEANIKFPVDGFDKLNGFLCITGYSERTGELVIASKSRVDGTFAEYAQELVRAKLGDAGMEKMLRFNRDQVASLIFEAVDMKNDPHIIDYDEDKLVLIGCVRRSEKFEQVDYETLVAIAKWLGVEVKERLFPQIKNWRALSAIMDRVENSSKWRQDNPTEGIVFQDAAGFQWKSKAWYYARLKRCRSAVERIALTRRKDTAFDRERYEDMPEFMDFLDWAQTLPDEALSVGIIALYKMYQGNRGEAEAMGIKPQPKVKDMSGYIRAIEGVAEQCKNGTAKIESVQRMIDAAMDDEDKKMAFNGSDAGDVLLRYVEAQNV